MIKKILFIISAFFTGAVFSQSFQLLNHNDISIGGTDYYEYGDALSISETKFHVENTSGVLATYKTKVQLISNPTSSGLQICYGVNCYVASGTDPSIQFIGGSNSVLAGATDSSFKVAPFTFSWVQGDSCTWRITVYNMANANDSVSAIVHYKTYPVSVDELTSNDVKLNAYPNPVSNQLNINYVIDGSVKNAKIDVYDVLGQKVESYLLNDNKGKLTINTNKLNAGVYFYAIKVDEKTKKTERVIVK